jgi:hypothetical protein
VSGWEGRDDVTPPIESISLYIGCRRYGNSSRLPKGLEDWPSRARLFLVTSEKKEEKERSKHKPTKSSQFSRKIGLLFV